ncbi:hypothetical protein EK21DRAFT_58153, partial [Setomelanomma holmii]
ETPTRAKVRGAIRFLEAKKIPYFKQDVFDHFAVSHRQGWAMISEAYKDRQHHRPKGEEHRGRPRKVTIWHPKEMDRTRKEDGFEARKMSWLKLGFKVGLEGIDARTTAHAMGNSMSYHKCIAC